MGNDRCGSGGPLKRSYVITGSHTPFEQGPREGLSSHTTWRITPGNAANLDLTDSTHLSVWSSSLGFMLASLVGSVYVYKSVVRLSVIPQSAIFL